MKKSSFISKFIGDRAFYKRVFAVAIPIMIQTGITNFVSLLDNIMVGATGTLQMSGVSIVNQIIFVFNLCVFGGLSGAGLFSSQFWGKKDEEGLRHVFRMKILIGLVICTIGVLVLHFFGEGLISEYLSEDNTYEENYYTMLWAKDYLSVAIWGLIPFCAVQIYAGSLRETEETFVPMIAGIVAVFVNLVFNWLLIFGKLGFPELGVKGAAIATVMSRFVELLIVVVWTYCHTKRFGYFKGALRSLYIPFNLFTDIVKRGTPLLLNEFLWSLGMAVLLKCYSERGISVVAAMNINNTIVNLFNVTFFSMGNAIAIIIGKHLGAGETERAKDEDRKLIMLSITMAVTVGILLFATSGVFPSLYNTEEDPLVKPLASTFIKIAACFMPMHACLHSTYFTIRCGGKTGITFLFDCGFTWAVMIPVALVLAKYTTMPVEPLYAIVLGTEFIKVFIGLSLVKKGIWVNNLVNDK